MSMVRLLVGEPISILMLHRFADARRGVPGHDPGLLRRRLEFLRQEGYPLLSLENVLSAIATGEPLTPGGVVFTVDDGYADFAEIGEPVFNEFDCPVTVFLGTGFLDRTLWYWWDQVEYLFEKVELGDAPLELSAGPDRHRLSLENRDTVRSDVVEGLKRLPERDKLAAIAELAGATGVELPEGAPPRYLPMTWDQVRAAAAGGVTFGPHSVTHPTLARLADSDSAREITESWDRVRAETDATVPVFCYPNGDASSYGSREAKHLSTVGLQAAVSAEPGYLGHSSPAKTQRLRFRLPRFPYSDNEAVFRQVVSGMERVKQALHGART